MMDELNDAMQRAEAAEETLKDWARSVMFATAGLVPTPAEGFVKAPHTLHRAVKELREACETAQGEVRRKDEERAALEAEIAELRRALEFYAESQSEQRIVEVTHRRNGQWYFVDGGTVASKALAHCSSPIYALSAYRTRVLEEAAQACEDEACTGLEDPELVSAHNRACEDCAAAVRGLGEQG